MKLSADDKYYDIKLSTLITEKNKCLETADNFDKKTKTQKKKKKRTLHHYLERQEEDIKIVKLKA